MELATSGAEGLEILANRAPFAVVVSDMRMPKMDGTRFLSIVKKRSPNTVRVLLSGQADMNDAIAVINEGQIFRFLVKPCSPQLLANALDDAIAQYHLLIAEKELMQKTLGGSIKVLVDLLAMARPEAFTRSNKLRDLVIRVAKRVHVKNLWEAEFSILLSHIGLLTLPTEISKKRFAGSPLEIWEIENFMKHPQIGAGFLKNIPRLQGVAKAILYQEKRFDGFGPPEDEMAGDRIPLISRILKLVHDYDELKCKGATFKEAKDELHSRDGYYDPQVLTEFDLECISEDNNFKIKELSAKELQVGMVVAEDVTSKDGGLLVPKGRELTDVLLTRIVNFDWRQNVNEPIMVVDA
jgi:response regulator RpfG family c-di-GMP phosphodiesterase